MSDFQLQPDAPTDLAFAWSLRIPGATGTGHFEMPASGQRRAEGIRPLPGLDEMLAGLDLSERAVIELKIEPTSPLNAARRAGAVGEQAVAELEMPPPPEGFEQILLEVGEDGSLTWHTAYERVAGDGRRSGGERRRYQIPMRPTIPGSGEIRGERRGPLSIIGRRLLKVLVYPITDFVVGSIEKSIARAWESAKAPYGLRTFDVTNYQASDVGGLSLADWQRLAGGRALLFLHGTFSTAHGCFRLLPGATLQSLSARYSGRLFAFNHWTMSHNPTDNVRWLLEQMPAEISLDLDIICHSRGGLVARVLASALAELNAASRIRVGRLVFVATPNNGTALASANHIVDMLDRYTNAVQFLPDGPLEVVLEGVVTAVKTLAHAGLTNLPGLAAQDPSGDYLKWLRSTPPSGTRYYAIAADWEPANDSPFRDLVKQKVADTVMDQVFDQAKNDLVVPTLGVAEVNDGSGSPVSADHSYTFPADAGAIHTNLFKFVETSNRLLSWLDGQQVT